MAIPSLFKAILEDYGFACLLLRSYQEHYIDTCSDFDQLKSLLFFALSDSLDELSPGDVEDFSYQLRYAEDDCFHTLQASIFDVMALSIKWCCSGSSKHRSLM